MHEVGYNRTVSSVGPSSEDTRFYITQVADKVSTKIQLIFLPLHQFAAFSFSLAQ
jgi:hypothetical protein